MNSTINTPESTTSFADENMETLLPKMFSYYMIFIVASHWSISHPVDHDSQEGLVSIDGNIFDRMDKATATQVTSALYQTR